MAKVVARSRFRSIDPNCLTLAQAETMVCSKSGADPLFLLAYRKFV